MADANVIRIKPLHYIHVLDNNSNLTRIIEGPTTFTREEHEQVVSGPHRMITIPPRSYCIIKNPIVMGDSGPEKDEFNCYKLKHGDKEIRFEQDPFPLYPGEALFGGVTKLQHVAAQEAFKLKAERDFHDDVSDVDRVAGDEWLFFGPKTYIPRVEVKIVQTVKSTTIKENFALKLRAKADTTDAKGNKRRAGEEWLYRETGSYLPGVNEIIVEKVQAQVLTEKKALKLRATRAFTDVFNIKRHAGDEWLVTMNHAETHIPDVYEQKLGVVYAKTLTNRQYCVVLDPVDPDTLKPRLGHRELRKGETTFFLLPGERLKKGIQDVDVLGEDEALLVKATSSFTDDDNVTHKPGEEWMIKGPCDYVPPVEVEIVKKLQAIPLDENEGIYVRNISSGEVSMITGESHLLKPNERLWEKELPTKVENLLKKGVIRDSPASSSYQYSSDARDKTRVVTYRAPHNSAVQIYDYKKQKSRIVYGPELVMLGPDEQFTILSLSGDRPKRANVIDSLCLLLGPDFMTDSIVVETADHARLSLQLAYNWHFEVDKDSQEDGERIFAVPDFVGDCCKAIASRIRGAVAGTSFEHFHKNAIEVINRSVFGVDKKTGQVRNRLVFSANNLVVSNIDIQEVEPVDQKTRESLQRSVQLAIEITTRSQEANARREAERKEQEAKGQLERQRIEAEAQAEAARKDLIELRAQSLIVEHSGSAKAAAKAKAAATEIKGTAAVTQAELESQTLKIKSKSENNEAQLRYQAELQHKAALDQMEIDRAGKLASIESEKFAEIVKAIGPNTIKKIAQAGPAMQAKLLKSLGLKSFLITDGNSPINLFSTANGLVGHGGSKSSSSSSSSASTSKPQSNQPGDNLSISGLDSDFNL